MGEAPGTDRVEAGAAVTNDAATRATASEEMTVKEPTGMAAVAVREGGEVGEVASHGPSEVEVRVDTEGETTDHWKMGMNRRLQRRTVIGQRMLLEMARTVGVPAREKGTGGVGRNLRAARRSGLGGPTPSPRKKM